MPQAFRDSKTYQVLVQRTLEGATLPDVFESLTAGAPLPEVRAMLDRIMLEQNDSNSDRFDSNSAAKIGKLLGVDAIIVGSITKFGRDDQNTNVGGGAFSGLTGGFGGFGRKKATAVVAITTRVIDVNTAEILAVITGNGASTRKSTSVGGGGRSGNGRSIERSTC